MRKLTILLTALILTSCGGNSRPVEVASLDFGDFAVVWLPAKLPLRGVEVQAPSWLGGTAIQYRLLFAAAMKRESYSESRWAAPPAELIERSLNRQVTAAGNGCRLRLDLDELSQVFDTLQASRSVLDVRASLVTPNRDAVLARKAFSLMQAAPSADARGGAAAAAADVQALGGELGKWLEQLARGNPALLVRCGGD